MDRKEQARFDLMLFKNHEKMMNSIKVICKEKYNHQISIINFERSLWFLNSITSKICGVIIDG